MAEPVTLMARFTNDPPTDGQVAIWNDELKIWVPTTLGAGSGDMIGANNLSELTNITTAKTKLVLQNVDNTSDANKPVSTATQTALDLKSNTSHNHTGVYAPVLGADDNYVTDAEKTVIGNTSGTNTGDQDLSGKQNTLVSGTNIKTVNGSSLLGSGNLTVSASITETEIDVGSTPVSEASIAVTDAGVSASSKILGGVAYKAPTGKDLDELEMDALDIKFEPGTGTFNVNIKGLEGYIADTFIIWYQVA